MIIKEAATKEDIITCYEVIKELRPHHTVDSFCNTVKQMQAEGYHLLYMVDEDKPVCAAGFRFTTTLYDGVIIDFDDLVTIANGRKKGYASMMFDHIIAIAKERSITTIHLNSAHHRFDAHRFYLNKKMHIVAHHFRIAV